MSSALPDPRSIRALAGGKVRLRRDGEGEGEEAIVVENVSKRFRIPHQKKATFYDHLLGVVRGGSYSYEVFSALEDVSFTVRRGETFGVIGPNGCGKSTLLKILAGVLYPDSGRVKIEGKVAPFLELGVGFQPELSAVEKASLTYMPDEKFLSFIFSKRFRSANSRISSRLSSIWRLDRPMIAP